MMVLYHDQEKLAWGGGGGGGRRRPCISPVGADETIGGGGVVRYNRGRAQGGNR